jgi:hypothetical protein
VTGGGRVRRAVHADEVGVLVKTHYNNDLSAPVRLWCDVLMADGVVTVPDWCLEISHETETR